MPIIRDDYPMRVYAGVLGKIIGVYLGRPFEGWTHERIARELGFVDSYVHERIGVPLIVTDDDITGTFTFIRTLEDEGVGFSSVDVGHNWLNYIIENRTILWWGGMGMSTEHTAYLRLKHGVMPPRSGAIETNGRVVAEQIGAQIFIDGWGLVSPGDPELAADFAGRAARVSHDGEAVHAARVIAAMVASAFVESDIHKLIDTALRLIPADSMIARLIHDLRGWSESSLDWRSTRELLEKHYGYHKFGGACHIVPNHGVIILALLHGEGDFSKTLAIANSCGWDTDCNSGNTGCIMGVRGGVAAIDTAPVDWRGPVADRLYLPTADGGRAITDAATQSIRLTNLGRSLVSQPPTRPKNGARFHFDLPGSVQGFVADHKQTPLFNVTALDGTRRLRLRFTDAITQSPARALTATFIPPEAMQLPHYRLLSCPTLSPGQTVTASVSAPSTNLTPVSVRLCLDHYNGKDTLSSLTGDSAVVHPNTDAKLTWVLPSLDGQPIARIGLEVTPAPGSACGNGAIDLDWLTWNGAPTLTLGRPHNGGTMWTRAWVDAVDHFGSVSNDEPFSLTQNEGRGMVMYGDESWRDYEVAATLRPHLATSFGIAARVRGLRRYICLQLDHSGTASLVRWRDTPRVLMRVDYPWELGQQYGLGLVVEGSTVTAQINGVTLFVLNDDNPAAGGGIALLVEEGRMACGPVRIVSGTT